MPTANEIAMLQAARAAGVDSREELSNLMAQIGAESGGLTQMQESFRYTRGVDQIPVRSVFREGRQAADAARLEAVAGRPQELARLMYGGRMGNDDAGDGYLYRGRGYTQLTGQDNYKAAGNALDLDLLGNPDLAVDRENAGRIALWFWQNEVPRADRDDVTGATLAINNGTNGLADRHNRFDAWHAQLTPQFIADLDAGRVRPGGGVGPAAGRAVMADGALRRFESGPEVRKLNSDLRELGIRAGGNRELRINSQYGEGTEQAVRNFQMQRGLPVTGRAGPETLAAVQDALVERRQHGQPARPGAPGNIHPAALGRPADNGPRVPRPQPPEPHARLQRDSRDEPLYDAIRRQLPEGTSHETAAFILLQAKRNGVHQLDKLDKVIVHEGNVWIAGKTAGEWAKVDLSGPAPPLEGTLRGLETFDAQRLQQLGPAQQQDQAQRLDARTLS